MFVIWIYSTYKQKQYIFGFGAFLKNIYIKLGLNKQKRN